MSKQNGLKAKDFVSRLNNKNTDNLPVSVRADLLGIARSSVYYQAKPVCPKNLDLMSRIDGIYTDYPFYGSRKISKQLSLDLNEAINRKRVQRLMRLMGIEAIYPKRNLSLNRLAHPVFPYLLRGIPIVRPNQVWGTDITYIRMKEGFLYLTAILDWYSRFVLSWELSNSLDNWFCVATAKNAIDRFGLPDITNSDQGVQFTSTEYLDFWQEHQVKISMDGRGRAMDNIFTERLWRTLKYEEVYLKSYQSVGEAKEQIGKYFEFYNYRRLHQGLNYQTPAQIYLGKEVKNTS